MSDSKRKNVFKDDFDGEYIGNVFGWKFSITALVMISAFIGLYFLLSHFNKNKQLQDYSKEQIHIEAVDTNAIK